MKQQQFTLLHWQIHNSTITFMLALREQNAKSIWQSKLSEKLNFIFMVCVERLWKEENIILQNYRKFYNSRLCLVVSLFQNPSWGPCFRHILYNITLLVCTKRKRRRYWKKQLMKKNESLKLNVKLKRKQWRDWLLREKKLKGNREDWRNNRDRSKKNERQKGSFRVTLKKFIGHCHALCKVCQEVRQISNKPFPYFEFSKENSKLPMK